MNRDSEHLACRFDAFCKRLLKHEVIDAIGSRSGWASGKPPFPN